MADLSLTDVSLADLSLGERVCLALVAEEPRHGWAVVKELEPGAELGAVWTLNRALTYRALDGLVTKGLVVRGAPEPGARPHRIPLSATDRGRALAAEWLAAPVSRVRALRTEFLLKATMVHRAGGDLGPLIDRQVAVIAPIVAERADWAATTPRVLWRQESAVSALAFLERLRALPPLDR